jgi:PAS domain S-box-containing protein
VDVMILSIDFAFAMYAIALFRYRLLNVVPVARDSAVERMTDAMVVLDAADRIADLNPAAQELLAVQRSRALGRDASEALGPFPALAELARDHASRQTEIPVGNPPDQRWYQVSSSRLTDERGFRLGSLIVLHDITPLKQAHERLILQERALAALRERERLARELHDSVGQVLAYVSLQADAARKLLDDDKASLATNQLGRLATIARDAHADVREFILALRAAPAEHRAFFPAMRRYLEGFTQNYGIVTALAPPDDLDEAAFEPEAEAQLFRIIQEALSNARKHGDARSVKVTFARQDGLAHVAIQDDGKGFDPGAVEGGFGLRFMRERAAEVGGSVHVQSAPGEGTRVTVALPLRQLQEA